MTDLSDLHYRTGESLPGWQGAEQPPHTVMAGRYCRLEPMSPEAHLDSLYDALQRGEDVRDWLYLPWGPFETRQAFDTWFRKLCDSTDPLFFAICEGQDGPAVGFASFLNIHPATGSVEVGAIHYSPRLQRAPAATEAMYLMMRRAFECGFRRYEWKCDSMNQRSRRAAQRLGFSYEGLFRQHLVVKERNRDTAWYACVDNEWPALEMAYQAWLDPDNFDSTGSQKQRLADLTAPVLKAKG